MNITINALELASELAHDELMRTFPRDVYRPEDANLTEYTDEAQDRFDELYDEKLTYLEYFKV